MRKVFVFLCLFLFVSFSLFGQSHYGENTYLDDYISSEFVNELYRIEGSMHTASFFLGLSSSFFVASGLGLTASQTLLSADVLDQGGADTVDLISFAVMGVSAVGLIISFIAHENSRNDFLDVLRSWTEYSTIVN